MKSNKKYLQEWRDFTAKLLLNNDLNFEVQFNSNLNRILQMQIILPILLTNAYISSDVLNKITAYMKKERAINRVTFTLHSFTDRLVITFFAEKK